MNKIKEKALEYLSHNISVIPCGIDKKPLVSWKEFQTRIATKEEVEEWFIKFPDMQIGIVTGKISGLIVVDIDDPMADLSWLPKTAVVQTGSGGFHYYYKYSINFKNKARIKENIDIRAEGGYCFTSNHKAILSRGNNITQTTIKIQDIKIGDTVIGYNEKNGKIEETKVVDIYKHSVKKTLIFKFDLGKHGGEYRCTPEHPFLTTIGWKRADEIKEGDELFNLKREDFNFQKTGHKFSKGIQNNPDNSHVKKSDYKLNYKQRTPIFFTGKKAEKTNAEKFVESVANELNIKIKYVGDGSLIIKQDKFLLHPDFIIENTNKIIEVHTEFYDKYKQGGNTLRDISIEERIELYKKAGYKVLWLNATKEWMSLNENTIHILDEVRKKILQFYGNGLKIKKIQEIYEDVDVFNIHCFPHNNYFIGRLYGDSKSFCLAHNCIAPPSKNLKGEYKLVNKMELQPFPAHLFYKVDKPIQQYIKTEFNGFSQGNRNHEMTKYIGHLLAKIHPSEWKSIGWKMAIEANEKNEPPLEERELQTIFDSIANAENNNTTERWFENKEKNTICNIEIKNEYFNRYTWGTYGLDSSLAILKRGNFVIVGAKRSSGKTTFTFDMACKNAMLEHKVLYISLEMEEQKIIEDFSRKYAGITVEEEYNYQIPAYKQLAFDRKIKEIKSIKNLFFRGMRRGSGTSMGAIIKIINEFKDIDLIFIDNLDLIDGEIKESNNERQIRITKKIMNFTEEYKIPLVLIHHHRKMGNSQKDYGSDELSGSGKIGDNADIILKISRNQNAEAEYPEKNKSTIFQQKGRGYPDCIKSVYFVGGSFYDIPPNEENSYIASINKMEYINK